MATLEKIKRFIHTVYENSNLLSYLILAYVLLQLPSLRPLFKYTPEPLYFLIPFYLLLVFVIYSIFIYILVKKSAWSAALYSPITAILLLCLITILSYWLYQYQLSLQSLGRGSDSSYALIQSGQNLLHGAYPYKDQTYYGNAISTGPGWVLLTLPFAHPITYPLLTPFLLLVLTICYRHYQGNWCTGNIYLFLLCSSASFWELLGSGIDLLPLGIAFCLLLLLTYYNFNKHYFVVILLSIAAGLLATSRIVFFYLAPVISYLIYTQTKKIACVHAVISLFTIAIIYGLLYWWAQESSLAPAHLLGKSGFLTWGYKITIVITTTFAGFILIFGTRKNLANWYWLAWLLLITPLSLIAIADLGRRNWDITAWEGANYISLTYPLLLSWVSIKLASYKK